MAHALPPTPTEAELADPVWIALRFAQDRAKMVVDTVYRCCITEADRKLCFEKGRALTAKLTRTEIKYTRGTAEIGAVMEEMQDANMMSDENVLRDVIKLGVKCKQRAMAVKDTITDDEVWEHASYKSFLQQFEELETERLSPKPKPPPEVEPAPEPQEELIPITDPITKQSLNDPVRNRHCGHIYGKSSILELVRKNPQIRCPTIGCGNRNYIKKNDLVYDAELAQKINKKQRDAAKKKIELQKQQEEAAAAHEQRRHRSPRHRHHNQSPK